MCTRCHAHFDDYNVGVDPDTQEVLISPRIYDDPIEGASGQSNTQKLVHVNCATCKHPKPLLEYRKERYDVKQKSGMINKYSSLGKRNISEVKKISLRTSSKKIVHIISLQS